LRKVRARGLQQLSVLHACRTRLLASTATETAIDVTLESFRICGETLFFDSSHQVDAPARAVIFIASLDVRRASLQTQPAMHTRQQLLLFRREHRCELRLLHQV
jgi:hypothetical protein